MANIKTTRSKEKQETEARRVIVIPRSNETYKEKFAVANGAKIPFETPVVLTPAQIKVIEMQKEPIKESGNETVYQIMDRLQIDQKKAAQILQQKRADGMDTRMAWKQKYIVKEV